MAVYKVPQNVEADDKLLGPFSFRQFVYLIVVALLGGAAWALAQLFIGLVIIPIPFILLFGALALPLRKDQPMEIYLAAIVSFHLKPRKRLWDPEGVESLIEIIAPKNTEVRLTKDLTQADAEQRFSYLANIVDSGGWAIRGVSGAPNSSMNTDLYYEAQNTTDVLDNSNEVAQSFEILMERRTQEIKAEARDHMLHPVQATPLAPPENQVTPQTSVFSFPASPVGQGDPSVTYNPYPDIHQSIIQPLNDPAHQYQQAQPMVAPQPAPAPVYQPAPQMVAQPQPTPVPEPVKVAEPVPEPTTSDKPPSPDIINLASNHDLSIETMAHEAKRIHEKEKKKEMTEEVIISLR